MTNDTKIAASILLICFAVIGSWLVTGKSSRPDIMYSRDYQPGGINYDTTQAQAKAMPINETALREIKRQDVCVDCLPFAQRTPTTPQPTPAKPSKLVSLPVAPKYSISLFVGLDAPSQTLLEKWNTDADLQKLKRATNFNVYTKDNPLFKSRFADLIPVDSFPAILFTDPEGGSVWVASKDDIPISAAGIWTAMQTAYHQQLEIRNTPTKETAEEQKPSELSREPLLNPERDKLFPLIKPSPKNPFESILYWLWNPGEALLVMLCALTFVMLCLVVLWKVMRS